MCRRILLLTAVSFFFAGCAFTQANLDINYDMEKSKRGPLSEVEPLKIEVGQFDDRRPNKERIGYKRNGFGDKTADILTMKPVADIVREAFMTTLAKNGHLVGQADNDIVLEGKINTFWFDYQVNFWTVEFMGTVSVDLEIRKADSAEVIYTRRYDGHYNEESMGGLEGTWERVMNTALEKMIKQASTDSKLIAAIGSLKMQ